ncbi:hypothetical protein [Roseibium aggregatum]|uniref:DUF945 domain-containing protein n=1 Tax=Roseibium aggregatum TaxID=187304 RepID=A0A939E9C6_9HYPH|nr:hypothetical protein [Roseibium aggregatum]MBN9668718.1 hypothetical protein [Roseibium aggregatum]
MFFPSVSSHLRHKTASRSRVVSFGVALVLISSPAFAQDTGLAAFNAYVDALKSLGLTVENGAVNYDAASNTLTVTNSTISLGGSITGIAMKEPGEAADGSGSSPAKPSRLTWSVSFTAGTLTFAGLSRDANSFSADKIVYSDDTNFRLSGSVEGEGRIDVKGRLAGTEIDNYDFTIPAMPAEDPERPVSRWLPFVKSSLLASYTLAKADNIGMTFEAYEEGRDTPAVSGTMQMDGYRISDVVEGRVGEYSVDQVTQSMRTRDLQSGEMLNQITSQGKTIYQNMDFNAVLSLFDPSIPETGEKMTLIESGSTVDYENKQELGNGLSVNMSVEKVSMADVTVTKRENDLLALFDALLSKKTIAPDELILGAFQVYRSFGLADARVSGFTLNIPTPDSQKDVDVAIEEMAMTNVSSEGIGEMLLVGLNAPDLPGGGFATLEWASINDISFAEFAPMKTVIGEMVADKDYAKDHPMEIVKAFVPRSFGYEIEGLEVNLPDTGTTEIGKAEFSVSTTVPPIPTSLYARNDGIRVPVKTIKDLELRTLFEALGLDTVVWSDETRLTWDEATLDLRLERLMVDIEGLGRAEASARFANVPKALFEDPQGQGQLAAIMAQFVEATVTFKDAGLVAKGLPHMAYLQGVPEETLRSALVAQAVAASGQLKNQAFTAMVSEAATKFLNNPNGLRVTLTPANPVPLTNILGSLATAPQALPNMLNVNVAAE